jgi:CheY-like chemotaxis protein
MKFMEWENKSILIAEDYDANYFLLEEYLEPTAIKIYRAKNGEEVLEILAKSIPDLILMDIKMPKMSGLEAIIKIREFNRDIPIIAQTAYAMQGDEKKIIVSGCNDYISKPIEEEALIEKLKKYLG